VSSRPPASRRSESSIGVVVFESSNGQAMK
jgi:hypothetical protein